jgi:mono/diheme cytochrome c family protein
MTRRGLLPLLAVPLALAAGALLGAGAGPPAAPEAAPDPAPAPVGRFVASFCAECHNADDPAGGLALDAIADAAIDDHSDVWEKVVRRLATRQMPPAGAIKPSGRTYDAVLATLTAALDRRAAAHPDPGRTDTFRRLTRAEYQNAVRDLLALDIDAATLLPNDESSRGFDNITVGDLSPTLLERYITAAQVVSRRAVGGIGRSPDGETFRLPADLTQEGHVEGLPLGTRGGAVFAYTFPREGDYEVQVRLARDRNEHVEGLREPHELEVLLDDERRATFTVRPPKSDGDHQTADAHLKARLRVPAGPHRLGVTFVARSSSLLETKRQPYQAHYNMHRHPRLGPAVYQVSITGPYDPGGPGDTPSRRRVFTSSPAGPDDEEACARRILAPLLRRAYRRPVAEADLERPMALFRQGRAEGGFEAGIELALAGVLVNPSFLFRIEADPPGVAPGAAYALPDVALASRLSFFLWGSLPDDELLDLAGRGELGRPGAIAAQARRMLADPRSRHLVTGFADQWLHLRNLDAITPDLRLFPDFDDNLRQAFRRETEELFGEVLREDRGVLDLLRPGHTYLNERLAKHYGIPGVYGDRFRRVDLGPDGDRGGLLRQGSILTVTSYATRTSPVIRGKWVLENLLGTPPPPPPANVPALKDNTVDASLSVRERLAEHRANPACAGCHTLMDPPGFALENFDAVGRFRATEEGRPIDSSGGLPDGSAFEGVAGLERALARRPEVFATALTEKLLTFATGRLVTPADGPAIRRVVADARADGYRLSSLIVGIAQSPPFRMRRAR